MERVAHSSSGSIAAATAMALVGSSVAAANTLADYPVCGGQALRYGLASVVLIAIGKRRLPRLTLAQLGRLILLAAAGLAGFNVLLVAAVREANPAGVGVIVGSVPVVLALLGPMLERRTVSRNVVVAAVVVTTGAAAVQWSDGGLSSAGLALALGALACEAAFSLLAVPLLRAVGPRAVSTYACLLATPMLLAAGLALDRGHVLARPGLGEAAALVYLAALVTGAGFCLWYSAVGRLGVERAGLYAGLVPIAALGSAAAIGATELTPLRLLGALAVGAGIAAGQAGAHAGARRGVAACRTRVARARAAARRGPLAVPLAQPLALAECEPALAQPRSQPKRGT